MSLEYYARRLSETRGFVHLAVLVTARRYIRKTPVDVLVREVEGIREPEHLRALWEAGIPVEVQQATIKHWKRLVK